MIRYTTRCTIWCNAVNDMKFVNQVITHDNFPKMVSKLLLKNFQLKLIKFILSITNPKIPADVIKRY